MCIIMRPSPLWLYFYLSNSTGIFFTCFTSWSVACHTFQKLEYGKNKNLIPMR